MTRPENGWAYSPIELEAIWSINVPIDELVAGNERVIAFHERAAILKVTTRVGIIDDAYAATLIKLALVSEIVNDEPTGWCVRCGTTTPFEFDFCDPCLQTAIG